MASVPVRTTSTRRATVTPRASTSTTAATTVRRTHSTCACRSPPPAPHCSCSSARADTPPAYTAARAVACRECGSCPPLEIQLEGFPQCGLLNNGELCGREAVSGCWCTDDCHEFGTCCWDVCDACGFSCTDALSSSTSGAADDSSKGGGAGGGRSLAAVLVGLANAALVFFHV
mmetsp:Transcript_7551/g.30679  ORF Transcript_7551/g.30679 Transcript_7551/m.30679 type:complete len:174 (-) Transcript_7551:227-748(-)